MIDPRTVCVAIPCYSGRNVCELTGSIWTWQGLFAALSMKPGCSHPSLVRNLIAGQFLDSPFEWLVCVDDDIYPTRRDMELLLEPTDPTAMYFTEGQSKEMNVMEHDQARCNVAPQPTRIAIDLVQENQRDLNKKYPGAADVLVNAEYCYKDDELKPVKFGMGFTRIHRSVFRTLENLKHPPNPDAEAYEKVLEWIDSSDSKRGFSAQHLEVLKRCRPDPGGDPRLWQTNFKGKLYTDFFPSGPLISQFVPTAEWKGEDHGFFTLCMIAGIIPRIETRTRLIHVGTKGFAYDGPDTGLAI